LKDKILKAKRIPILTRFVLQLGIDLTGSHHPDIGLFLQGEYFESSVETPTKGFR
jgi:hypothetical protein